MRGTINPWGKLGGFFAGVFGASIAGSHRNIMRSEQSAGLWQSGLSVWTCIVAAIAVVAAVGSTIGIYDVRRHVEARREDELGRRQSHAVRSADHIASELLEDGTPTDLAAVKHARWLRTYWTQTVTRQPYRLYAAVIDLDGNVVAHTDHKQEGKRLDLSDEEAAAVPAGPERVEMKDDVLTSARRAIDVRVPIVQGGEVIGVYHAGVDADWLGQRMAAERAIRTRFWSILVSGMCGLVLLSSIGVVRVTQHTARLEHEIEVANTRRVSEMHELVLGIAHEIRNPLNAIRLNVHTVGQVFRDEAALSDEEIAAMLDEMEDEVARLETLMREMLGFVRTSGKAAAPIDVTEEIQRTLALLRANLEQRRIEVHLHLADSLCVAAMDATRLRQVLFNLLNNAIEALPDGGFIEITIRGGRSQVEIIVADDGPGIAPEDRERVFVPFFSTKASGTGLGLALARKFIEEAGGTIRCEDSPLKRGSCFRMLLPAGAGAAVESVS
jgi:two-component system, NtrC family, sensor histidine kinase HydH